MNPSSTEREPAAELSEEPELIVARYGELWLKGKNRRNFEQILARNVLRAVREISPARLQRAHGQLAIYPERRTREVSRRVQDIFGFTSVSPAWSSPKDFDAIARIARHVLGQAMRRYPLEPTVAFRVRTQRADKTFPVISTELDRRIADHVMPDFEERLHVDLNEPELTLSIHIRPENAYVYAERLKGAGGLPVGTLGNALCLLSGGIDSPVAAWLTMKRGCNVSFVSFHSEPYIGEGSKRKIKQLAHAVSHFQGPSRLYSVPFARCQEEIRDRCRPGYRTVLYRRMMQRIAQRIARRAKAGALITGDSLGQVASQTLENLTCIGAAVTIPVLRPLICFDKEETIALARRIGTFDLSIRPEPDCCTVFQPTKPVIRGSLAVCEEEETNLDVEALVDAAVAGVEIIRIRGARG